MKVVKLQWILGIWMGVIFSLTISPQTRAGQSVQIVVPKQLSAPARFALGDVERTLSKKKLSFRETSSLVQGQETWHIVVQKPEGRNSSLWPKAESYRISRTEAKRITVSGSDSVGLMYGLLELAERISLASGKGEAVLDQIRDTYDEPELAIRAVNPFITVEGETTGIAKWFYNETYWQNYFATLARSRFNLCDFHAMYRYRKTNFPNIFPFFLKNPSMPEAAWPTENQERNLAMLNRIIAIAEAHGVHVALMNYAVDTPNISMGDEAKLTRSIRWAVAEFLRRVPRLWMFGFRIGESGKSEEFFKNAYLSGIRDSGKKNVRLYTRTWLANFKKLTEIGMRYPEHFYIEIKYNGEHLGAPYQAIQGRWGSYSYQKYLDYPRYWKIIWQIRANGTHRLFPWNDAEFVRRTVRSCHLGNGVGMTLEPITAYFPQEAERTYKNPGSLRYTTERYWSWYLLWGRLAYDPDTPDSVFTHIFQERYGKSPGKRIYQVTTLGSRIIPLIYQHHCLGPDHRNFAPEFETGNRVGKYRNGPQNLDSFAKATVLDRQADLNCSDFVSAFLADSVNGRRTPLQAADQLDALADSIETHVPGLRASRNQTEWQLWKNDLRALANLARYYAEKDRAVVAVQFYDKTADVSQLPVAERHLRRAIQFWKQLVTVTQKQYKPIFDPLRTGKAFTWSQGLADLKADRERLTALIDSVEKSNQPQFGHVPPKRLTPGKIARLILGLATREKPKNLTCFVLVNQKPIQKIAGKPAGRWTIAFPVSAELLTEGSTLRYWFDFKIGHRHFQVPPEGKNAPFSVVVTADSCGPVVELDPARIRASRMDKQAVVEALVRDPSGVEAVWLEWKPMPSGIDWQPAQKMHRRPETAVWWAKVPYTYEGLLYGILARDRFGNEIRFPNARFQIPYRVIPSYDRGLSPEMLRPLNGRLSGELRAQKIWWRKVNTMGRPGWFMRYEGPAQAEVRFSFSVPQFADYRVTVGKVVSREFGPVVISVDGKPVGEMNDFMDVAQPIPEFEEFLAPRLNPGKHVLGFRLKKSGRFAVEGFQATPLPAVVDRFLISQSFPGYVGDEGVSLYPIGNPRVHWKKAQIDHRDIVRLDAQLSPNTECHAFAATEIVCLHPVRTQLRFGSNDGAIIWLNGKVIFKNTDKRAFKHNQFSVPISLKKGKNLLVLLISQAGRNWMFNVNVDSYDFRCEWPRF